MAVQLHSGIELVSFDFYKRGAANVVKALVVSPFQEELLFRGLLLYIYRKRYECCLLLHHYD
jgi:hypothetical protein